MRRVSPLLTGVFLLVGFHVFSQDANAVTTKIDGYVQPYVVTGNFSGTILVAQKGKVQYLKAFGLADEALNVPNRIETRYHIASLSKSFTAAAILLLQERRLLRVTDPLSQFIPDYPNGDKITLRHLLIHSSGIPNINDMPEYDTIMHFPQTPASLVAVFKYRPLDFAPGTKYSYSNSNYNLLAYVIEKVSGTNYGAFLRENIFQALQMSNTGHDGDVHRIIRNLATGYQPGNSLGLEEADHFDWSAKTGNGSLYSTVEDLYKWVQALQSEQVLSKASEEEMFTESLPHTGYGWFIDEHLGRKRIYFNGRSPGFTSYIGSYSDAGVTIIVLSNNYIPLATRIGSDLAAIVFHESYQVPAIHDRKIDPAQSRAIVGKYQFDSTFYRPGMLMTIREQDGHLCSDWGEMIPEAPLRYIDRAYWQEMHFVTDTLGRVRVLEYGGYKGVRKD
jgi:CubicO group peptidase (beta-lactamase class C family)